MPKKKIAVKIRSVLVAEDVRQEIDGKHSIIGLFSGNIRISNKEIRMPKVVVRVEFTVDEERELDIFFSVVSPSGKVVFEVPAPLKVPAKLGVPSVAVIGWGPATFEEEGNYQIRFGIDSPPKKIYSFEVHHGLLPRPSTPT